MLRSSRSTWRWATLRTGGLLFAIRAGAPLHRLRDVALALPAAVVLRRADASHYAWHRGDRLALARPDPRGGGDRAAGYPLRRAHGVRLRPRRGQCRV